MQKTYKHYFVSGDVVAYRSVISQKPLLGVKLKTGQRGRGARVAHLRYFLMDETTHVLVLCHVNDYVGPAREPYLELLENWKTTTNKIMKIGAAPPGSVVHNVLDDESSHDVLVTQHRYDDEVIAATPVFVETVQGKDVTVNFGPFAEFDGYTYEEMRTVCPNCCEPTLRPQENVSSTSLRFMNCSTCGVEVLISWKGKKKNNER